MISVYQLKPKFQALLRPLVNKLYHAKVTANQVTLAAGFGSLLIAVIVALFANQLWIFWLIPIWMLIRMALNAIDGMLAREFKLQSQLGAYLNEICDVVSDSALFFAFSYIAGVSTLSVIILIFLSFLTEYAGVLGRLVGASRRYDGPMGKSDRALAFGILAAGIASGLLPLSWIDPLLWLLNALLVYTLVNRIKHGLQEAASNTDQ